MAATATTATSCWRRWTSPRRSSSPSSRSTSPTSGATRCSSTATTCSRTRTRRSTSRRSSSAGAAAEGRGRSTARRRHAAQPLDRIVARHRRSARAHSARRIEAPLQRCRANMPQMAPPRVRVETGFLDDAEVVVVAFGTAAKFVRYVVAPTAREGVPIGFFRPVTLWPFPYEAIAAAAEGVAACWCSSSTRGQMVDDVRLGVLGRAPVAVHRRHLDRRLGLRRRRADLDVAALRACIRERARRSDVRRAADARRRPRDTTRRPHRRATLHPARQVEEFTPELLLTQRAPPVPGLRRAGRAARRSSR